MRRDIPLHFHQPRVPLDHGQDIVEIVRDASCELPESLHFLRLPQLFPETVALRDITHGYEGRRLAVIDHRGALNLHVNRATA